MTGVWGMGLPALRPWQPGSRPTPGRRGGSWDREGDAQSLARPATRQCRV